jgi:hypothetical protein
MIRVLVIGLTDSGKSHFIDSIQLLGSLSRRSTYMETSNYKNILTLTELGGCVDWEKIDIKVHCIYMVIRHNIHESNNALLMMCNRFKNVPVAIIWNNIKKPEKFMYPKQRSVCSCTLNYEEEGWYEKFHRLLEWTVNATKNFV